MRSGDFDAALLTLDAAIANAPDPRGTEALKARESRMVLLLRQLRYDDASRALVELEGLAARATVPDAKFLSDVRFRRGSLLALQGYFDEARTLLLASEAFESAGGNSEGFFFYGMLIKRADLELDRGNPEEARALMWQALQGREKLFGDANPRTLLAAAQLLRIGGSEAATAHATELLLANQSSAEPTADGHLAYAIIAQAQQDTASAIAELRKGLALDSEDSLMAVVLNERLGALLQATHAEAAADHITQSHRQAMRYYGPQHPRYRVAQAALRQ